MTQKNQNRHHALMRNIILKILPALAILIMVIYAAIKGQYVKITAPIGSVEFGEQNKSSSITKNQVKLENRNIVTHGDNSPVITGGGNVSINIENEKSKDKNP